MTILREGIFIHLRFDIRMLDTGIVDQLIHLYLVVEMSDVAHDRLVFHPCHVVDRDDIAITRSRDKNITLFHGLFHRSDLESFHRGLQGANRVDLRYQHACAIRTHRAGATFAHITITGYDDHLTGDHHVRGAFDAIRQRLAAPVKVIEFRFRHRVVHVDRGNQQLAPFHHLIQAVYTRSGLFRHTPHLLYRAMPTCIILRQNPTQGIENNLLLVVLTHTIDSRGIFLRPVTFMYQQRGVATIIHDQMRPLAAGEAKRHLRAPPIFLQALALPSEYRHAVRRDSRRRVVLRRKDVTTRPAYVRAQGHQGLDQYRGLDGHVQRAGDTCAFQGFPVGIFLAECHQSGHLVLSYLDFLAAKVRQTHIRHFIRQIRRE